MVLITLGEVKVSSSSSSDLIEGVSKSPSNAIIDDGFKVLFLFFIYCTNKVIKRGGEKTKIVFEVFFYWLNGWPTAPAQTEKSAIKNGQYPDHRVTLQEVPPCPINVGL